jgi:8-oxo-dGTP pyrophosphatase MutT (NUDIX family)
VGGDAPTVRAAGAVLRRDDGRIAVVHRARYDDWTFPKGKLERGESDEEGALREVLEETGYHGRIEGELGETSYWTMKSGIPRPKRVRYFVMDAVDGSFQPHDEVDDLRWLVPQEAREILSYDRDRDILEKFLSQNAADRLDGHGEVP